MKRKTRMIKILLLPLCLSLLQVTVQAEEIYGGGSKIGIVFREPYQTGTNGSDDQNGGKKKEDGKTSRSGSGTGVTNSQSPSAVKSSLPQTGELGGKETAAGILLAGVSAIVLGVLKREQG